MRQGRWRNPSFLLETETCPVSSNLIHGYSYIYRQVLENGVSGTVFFSYVFQRLLLNFGSVCRRCDSRVVWSPITSVCDCVIGIRVNEHHPTIENNMVFFVVMYLLCSRGSKTTYTFSANIILCTVSVCRWMICNSHLIVNNWKKHNA